MEEQTLGERISFNVNFDGLAFNFKQIKSTLPKDVKIMCIVKANAYGLGATKISRLFESLGANAFGVATLNEAIKLREVGIIKPILILGYTPPDNVLKLSKFNISQAVFSSEYAKALFECAEKESVAINVHLKIDTGMSRLGFFFQDKVRDLKALEDIKKLDSFKNLNVEGIFTHFLASDEGGNYEKITKRQIENFRCAVDFAKSVFKNIKFVHCSNSGAILNYKIDFCNMVRAGIVLYGYYPSNFVKNKIKLKPALEIRTTVVQVKEIPPGTLVSYGGTFITAKKTKIATVPIGYADGLNRLLSNKGKMIINGYLAPIVGKVCMDQCMLDVTDIPDVRLGSRVTVIGRDGKLEITMEDVAKEVSTIVYESLCKYNFR